MKLALLSLLALTLSLPAQDAPKTEAPKLQAWEYKVHTTNLAHGNDEKSLAKLGEEGWELVSVVCADGLVGKLEPNKAVHKESAHLRLYFKRLKAK